MSRKFLLVNQPLRNRGDEAAHRAFVTSLLAGYPDAHFEVLFVGADPADVEAFRVPDERVSYTLLRQGMLFWRVFVWPLIRRFPLRRLLWALEPTAAKLVRKYRGADGVICCPGGTCLGGQQSWWHLAYLEMARVLGRPTAYFARSIGPFPLDTARQRSFYAYSERLLKGFRFLSLRDGESVRYAREMGVEAVPTVDSAFLTAPQPALPEELAPLGGERYVVFVPNALTWMYSFREKVSPERVEAFFLRVLRHMLASDPSWRVLMLPQLFHQGAADDVIFFRRLAAALGDARVQVLPDTLGSDIQQRIIAGAEGLCGARYHSVVFALNNAVPFVAFSYEHKISGLLETLGATDRCVDLLRAFDSEAAEEEAFAAFVARWAQLPSDGVVLRERARAMAAGAFGQLIQRFP